jgi:Zinc knuckle
MSGLPQSLAAKVVNLPPSSYNEAMAAAKSMELYTSFRNEVYERGPVQVKRWKTEEELGEMRRQGLCFVCNRKGHLAKDCEQNKFRNTQKESAKKACNVKTIGMKEEQEGYEKNRVRDNGRDGTDKQQNLSNKGSKKNEEVPKNEENQMVVKTLVNIGNKKIPCTTLLDTGFTNFVDKGTVS